MEEKWSFALLKINGNWGYWRSRGSTQWTLDTCRRCSHQHLENFWCSSRQCETASAHIRSSMVPADRKWQAHREDNWELKGSVSGILIAIVFEMILIGLISWWVRIRNSMIYHNPFGRILSLNIVWPSRANQKSFMCIENSCCSPNNCW